MRRKRRILCQSDIQLNDRTPTACGIDGLIPVLFYDEDHGAKIDTILWDTHYFYADVDDRYTAKEYKEYLRQGVDLMERMTAETHKRGIECLLNFRICEVERGWGEADPMRDLHSMKEKLRQGTLRQWWWQGLWDLSCAPVREYLLERISGLVARYDFDGVCVGFARHTPCLPEGREWELREHVTNWMEALRGRLNQIGVSKARSLVLAAKVPENERVCRADGFDTPEWAGRELVDFFVLGCRTMDVDLEWYRAITRGTEIQLYPSFDDYHATDGYRYPSLAFLRGLFSNWLSAGADGYATFNWSCATKELYRAVGWDARYARETHRRAYAELGTLDDMRGGRKIYAVERRGGYIYAHESNQNRLSPLPAPVPNDEALLCVTLKIYETPACPEAQAITRLVFSGAGAQDALEVRLNGVLLTGTTLDRDYIDAQIFAPAPQPMSGGMDYECASPSKLTKISAQVPCALLRRENCFTVRAVRKGSYCCQNIMLEKAEIELGEDA